MFLKYKFILCFYIIYIHRILYCVCYFGVEEDEDCFCQLQGRIDDCACKVDTVDHFNNVKIYPRLRSLLTKDYFRFYKVNLKGECPFWVDDSRCAIRYCHVETCHADTIPKGLKNIQPFENHKTEKYWTEPSCEEDLDNQLGYLNTTISAKANEDFVVWKAHDDAQDNFCVINENDVDAEYVDLLLNPERYTGYRGYSAHRIWNNIYKENCFRPRDTFNAYIESKLLNGMCLEKRVFYRAISGLHTSINIHLCAEYLLSELEGMSLAMPYGKWGPNLKEFKLRFSSENTNGEGTNWLRNLYFLYLLEIRALAKAAPYLKNADYYTGNEPEDWDTQLAVKDLLTVIEGFPEHFDETVMFNSNGGKQEDAKLKHEFKLHFRNITRIMDCVGCEKCKLWGKLQIQGLGTALKILFSEKFDKTADGYSTLHLPTKRRGFRLERTEIVSLINSIGRLTMQIQ